MQSSGVTLYSLSFSEIKSYILATIFVAGNIALPQLCHFIPNGGVMLLPIYFFTLVAGYKYGWRVALLTAVMSPLINHLLFGMPPMAVLPQILAKSIILGFTASYAAYRWHHKPLLIVLSLVVLCYQIAGTLAEWAIVGDLHRALQDFRIGIIGMLIQVIGGYLLIGRLKR